MLKKGLDISKIVSRVVDNHLNENMKGNTYKFVLFSCDVGVQNTGWRITLFESDIDLYYSLNESVNQNTNKASNTDFNDKADFQIYGFAQAIKKLQTYADNVTYPNFFQNEQADELCKCIITCCKPIKFFCDDYADEKVYDVLNSRYYGSIQERFSHFLNSPGDEDDVNTIIDEELTGNHINHASYLLFECPKNGDYWSGLDYDNLKGSKEIVIKLLINRKEMQDFLSGR